MVILYTYLKIDNNIVACMPFRYNSDNEEIVESRELIMDITLDDNYDVIKQKLLHILDKEKQEHGKLTTEYSGDMSSVITIE